MAGKVSKLLLFLLLVLPSTFMFAGNGGLVKAEEDVAEDIIEGEEEEATVETEEAPAESGAGEAAAADSEKDEEEEESPMKPSPNADTQILFTKPTSPVEFPAGEMVKLLVGFTNKGDKDFTVETMEASFRYPQDYSFYIQNFTTVRFDRVIEPSYQATFEYAFTPSETFNARPFGLTINLNYKDVDGNIFQDAVFNETVNIIEADEGLDGETFFLYVFLAAVAVLLLVGAQQLLASMGVNTKKRLSKPKQQIEMGTQNKTDVDYDWLPKETLEGMNKSPRRSPKQSPGRRRTKRNTGGSED